MREREVRLEGWEERERGRQEKEERKRERYFIGYNERETVALGYLRRCHLQQAVDMLEGRTGPLLFSYIGCHQEVEECKLIAGLINMSWKKRLFRDANG